MRVQRLDHYSIRTTDLDQTLRFYTEVIGFVSGPARRSTSPVAGSITAQTRSARRMASCM